MRSKDLAKASGLAVAFDHTAPTFYRVSLKNARTRPKMLTIKPIDGTSSC